MGELARARARLPRRSPVARRARPYLILVDDGLTTGASMQAAIQTLKQQPARIVVAVPIGAPET